MNIFRYKICSVKNIVNLAKFLSIFLYVITYLWKLETILDKIKTFLGLKMKLDFGPFWSSDSEPTHMYIYIWPAVMWGHFQLGAMASGSGWSHLTAPRPSGPEVIWLQCHLATALAMWVQIIILKATDYLLLWKWGLIISKIFQ